MSDSDDSDNNIPSKEECEARCKEFAEVTGTDSALAMFYLQDREWDVMKALNAFFESSTSRSKRSASKNKPQTSKPASSSQSNASSTSTNQASATAESTNQKQDDHRIRVLSWNIDGLDENNLVTRTKAVAKIVAQERPDAVFLQEVTPQTQEILEDACPQYQVIPTNDEGYYTVMLLRCETTVFKEQSIKQFHSSKMGRNLLKVKASLKGIDCLLMTSHLESTKSHADERVRQLKTAFKYVKDASSDRTVVFGGDLNLRDEELDKAGGIPDNVYDLWEVTGKRPEAKYTWDTSKNDNCEMPGKGKPRCRFDRMYLRGSDPKPKIKPVYFELVGLERIPQCKRFPSDHWGLLAHFDKQT